MKIYRIDTIMKPKEAYEKALKALESEILEENETIDIELWERNNQDWMLSIILKPKK